MGAALLAPVSARAGSIGSDRQACEAALAREEAGQPTTSSRSPCHAAFVLGGQPRDLRNEVASLMSPAGKPTLDDLAIGSLMADAAVREASSQPWGYLARCDMARRLGSADTLQACLDDLKRVAPEHPAVRQALAIPAERASPAIWLGRVLLLLALLGTLAHAGHGATLARRRRARPTSNLARALLVIVICTLGGGIARAEPAAGKDQLSDFPIDDANPEASVPSPEAQNRKPLEFGYFLQDLAAKAERANKSGDRAAEARYYRALTKAAPTAAFGPRKLCEALEAAGDLPNAIVACRTAITRQGSTAGDYQHFVSLVLASKGPLPAEERKELDLVILHLANEAQLGAAPTVLRCEVALRFKDWPALEACTGELARVAPSDPKTVSLQWALALERNDRAEALRLIDKAKVTGMSAAAVAKMEAGTQAMTRRRQQRMGALFGAAALIGAAAWLARRRLSERRQIAA